MPKHNKLSPSASILLLLFFCALPVRAEWVEWLSDSRLAVQFDDNINTSLSSAQAEEDYVWSSFLSGGRAYQLDTYTRGYINALFSGDLHHRFALLDQYTLGGNALLTHKFGLGWAAPVISLGTSAESIFSSSELRSGEKIQGSLRLSKWLHHDVLHAHIAYRFDYRDGPDLTHPEHPELAAIPGSVFDIQGHTVEALLNLSLSDQLRFNVSYGWRWGDVTSNNMLSSVYGSVLGSVDAVHKDDALPGWIYRTYGTTQTYDVGLSYSFWGGHGLSTLGYRHLETQALGADYDSNQVRLGVNYTY
ncbi:MAG: hypothetical protein Q7U57_06325 [Methylovulum sp.]|nr:hypothetical protein [Methylovulum sp.]